MRPLRFFYLKYVAVSVMMTFIEEKSCIFEKKKNFFYAEFISAIFKLFYCYSNIVNLKCFSLINFYAVFEGIIIHPQINTEGDWEKGV